MASSQELSLTRWHDGQTERLADRVAIEEPLQVTVDGHPLAVLMRTPDHDEELVRGFLLTEGIITSTDQVKRIDITSKENHALVFLVDGIILDLARLTRHLFSASSCGLCGKATIAAITNNHPPVPDGPTFATELLLHAPDLLRASQATFENTGGLHASALFSREGELLITREDVGRHNALDKVLGHALAKGHDLSTCFLLLSGRVSFELMQKALVGRIPLLAAISAPSSLAVEFAETSNQTLLAFLRPPTVNIYCHPERVDQMCAPPPEEGTNE